MATDKLDSIVDIPKIEAEFTKINSLINGLVQNIQQVNTSLKDSQSSLSVSGNYSTINSTVKDTSVLLQDMAVKSKDLAQAQKDLTKAQEGGIVSSQNAAAALVDMRGQLAATNEEIKRNNKALENGTADYAAYEKRQAQLTERQIVLTAQIKAQTTELKILSGVMKDPSIAVATTAYKQLSVQYNEAALKAKNYAITLGATHPITREATADALALGNQLKSLDSAVGQNQRNVGNYGSALTKVWSFIRQAAYVIPGLGIAGIFSAIGTAILWAADKLGIFGDKVDNVKRKQLELNKAFESSAYKDAIKNINELTTNVKLAEAGFLDKTKVVNEYNETIGKTTGIVKTLSEVEQKLTDDGPAYLKMMLLKAAANSALEEAAKNAVKAEIERRRTDAESLSFLNELKGVFTDPTTGTIQTDRERAKARRERIAKEADDAQNGYEEIAKKFQVEAAKIAKKYKFDFFGGKNDIKTGAQQDQTNEKLSAQKLLNDETAKLNEQLYIQDAEIQKGIRDNTNNSLEQRLEAQKQYFSDQHQLLFIANTREEQDTQIILDKIEEIEKKSADKRTTEEKNLLLKKDGYLKQAERIQAEAQTRLNKIVNDGEKEVTNIYETNARKILATVQQGYADLKADAQEDENNKLEAAKAYHEKNQTSEREYQIERQRIIKESAVLLFNTEHEYLIKTLNDLKTMPGVTKEVVDAVNKLLAQLGDLPSGAADKALFSPQQLARIKNSYEELVSSLNAIDKIQEVQSQKRVKEIDNQIAAIEKKKDADIDALELTTLNQQELDDKKAEIQAVAQQREDALNAKKDQEEKQAATRHKALTISQITLATALAVVNALATTKPYSAAVASAISAGIAGAAELAVAIATPAYEFGTPAEGHKGGPARMFEKGKRELVIEKNGNAWVGNKEGIYNLSKGAHVIPLEGIMLSSALIQSLQKQKEDKINLKDVVSSFERTGNKMVTAILNKRLSVTNNINIDQSNYEYRNGRK